MPFFGRNEFYSSLSVFSECFDFIVNQFEYILQYLRSYPILYIPAFLFALLGVVYLVGWLILEVGSKTYGTDYTNPNKYYSSNIPAVIDILHLHKRKINANQIKTTSYSNKNDYRIHNLNNKISKNYSTKKSNYEIVKVPKRTYKRNSKLDIEFEE